MTSIVMLVRARAACHWSSAHAINLEFVAACKRVKQFGTATSFVKVAHRR